MSFEVAHLSPPRSRLLMLRVFSREAATAHSPWRQPGVRYLFPFREPRSGDSNWICPSAAAASRLVAVIRSDLRAHARSYVLPPLPRLKQRNFKTHASGYLMHDLPPEGGTTNELTP